MKKIIDRIINRIKIIYTDISVIIRYFFYRIINRKTGIAANAKRKNKIIISLTSFPERFDILHICLESLLNQTLKPDMIILWLYKEDVKHLPPRVLKLQERGITIRSVEENLRSYKKLYYALSEYKNDCIITCDDDMFFSSWFVEKLYVKWLDNPDCIIGYRCKKIVKTEDKKIIPYEKWQLNEIKQPGFNIFPTCGGGNLYFPRSLNEIVFNKDLFLKLCPTGDDIWFYACALLQGTKILMACEKSTDFPMIFYRKSQKQALWKANLKDNKYDEYIKNIFDYFDLYKFI